MVMFSSEQELLSTLDHYDKLIRDCAQGAIAFDGFLQEYHDFPFYYALDGHESDDEEKRIFQKHEKRIRPHFKLMEALSQLCSEEDSAKQQYIQAGRIGNEEALARLQELARNYF